jgi:hypothetical protein
MYEVTVSITGPVLTGQPSALVGDLVDRVTWETGAQALADWHRLLDQHIKQPTPYYETQLTLRRIPDGAQAHDRGVIYGPWLEGTARANQTAPFKGYHAARLATAYTAGRVDTLVEPVVRRWIGEVT